MDEQTAGEGRQGGAEPLRDITEGPHVGYSSEDAKREHLEMHLRGRRHGHDQQVDLTKDEYSPDEIARMLGTSLDVVMHAVRNGELNAQRAGHDVVCVKHADVVDWLRRRGPGV